MVASSWPLLGLSLTLGSTVLVKAQEGFVPLAEKTFSYVRLPCSMHDVL